MQRSGVGDALMWPMGVVEAFELSKGVEQMALIPDQGAVQEFPAPAWYPVVLQIASPVLAWVSLGWLTGSVVLVDVAALRFAPAPPVYQGPVNCLPDFPGPPPG